MNTYKMFIIEALSNMHVGSGDTHFGVVDNLIQRNPVTNVPVIHSSSLKGALREYFDDAIKRNESKITKEELIEFFGDTVDNKPEKPDSLKNGPGHLIFFEANLITLPLRSNLNVFYNCTSEDILIDYLESLKDFVNSSLILNEIKTWFKTMDFNTHEFYYFNGGPGVEIEDFTKGDKYTSAIPETIKTFLSCNCKVDIDHLAVFNENIFNRICQQSIPVVARNQIKEDGTSGNLFYEEVLPRKTKLYFLLGYDSYLMSEEKKALKEKFSGEFESPENIYQFGGNYSIGYGFSKLEKII